MSLICEESYPVRGGDFKEAGKVAVQIKATLKKLGLDPEILRRAAIAAYESEVNIISYARLGKIHLQVDPEKILMDVEDEGPGIEDIEMAMRPGYSTASDLIRELGFGAGMGLVNIKHCADEFEITSRVDQGTKLRILIHVPDG